MTTHAWLLLGIFLLVLLLAAKPLGSYIGNVMEGRPTMALRLGGGFESLLYRLCGVRRDEEMGWLQYGLAILLFNLLGALAVYALQRLQLWLPLNPQHFANVSPDSSFNTGISFATNTNWQGYSGESTMSYLTQMLGLTVQNFFSAATGIVVVIAMIRGFARHTAKTLGNTWVDLTRITLYVLVPISLVFAVFLVGQGAIQNFDAFKDVTTLTQTLPMGPVASQEAIKMLGTNGGGFFNANSAHPFENPTPLTNFIQVVLIFLIPAGLTYTFGRMVGDTRQGWAIFAAMALMFAAGVFVCYHYEAAGNPILTKMGVESAYTGNQPGGNMEGKETRFG